MSNFSKRRERLRRSLRAAGARCMLVTHPTNVTYLTGFTGDDSYLLLTDDEELLLSDPRFEEQIGEEAPGLGTFIRKAGEVLWEVAQREINKRQLSGLAIEADTLSVAMFDRWQQGLNTGPLIKGSGLVEALRVIKDKDEIELIRRAVQVAERVFAGVRAQLTARQTERDVACEIERLVRALGGSACAFKPIVAVGPRAALPHAVPGASPLSASPFVLIDWGAVVGGYRSDLTRVLATSKIPPKFSKAYEVVRSAQAAAIAALRPGVMVSQIDRVARDIIADAGMGARFNHGLGHGIGLDIHEAPRLGKNQDRALEAGMVVTVEPGVYYPGWGGIRIEDDVLITDDGHQLLSSLSTELAENCVELL